MREQARVAEPVQGLATGARTRWAGQRLLLVTPCATWLTVYVCGMVDSACVCMCVYVRMGVPCAQARASAVLTSTLKHTRARLYVRTCMCAGGLDCVRGVLGHAVEGTCAARGLCCEHVHACFNVPVHVLKCMFEW